MASAHVFSDQLGACLAWLADAAKGGALLIDPAGRIPLVRGQVTSDAARVALANSRHALSVEETACFACDDGSSVYLLPVADGWILVVQAKDRVILPDLAGLDDERRERLKRVLERTKGMGLRILIHRARADLRGWLAYAQLPRAGGRDSGQGGAPAEVAVVRDWKGRN